MSITGLSRPQGPETSFRGSGPVGYSLLRFTHSNFRDIPKEPHAFPQSSMEKWDRSLSNRWAIRRSATCNVFLIDAGTCAIRFCAVSGTASVKFHADGNHPMDSSHSFGQRSNRTSPGQLSWCLCDGSTCRGAAGSCLWCHRVTSIRSWPTKLVCLDRAQLRAII